MKNFLTCDFQFSFNNEFFLDLLSLNFKRQLQIWGKSFAAMHLKIAGFL